MSDTTPTVLLCDCTGTMSPDADAIANACGVTCSKVHTFLCRDEAVHAANALKSGNDVIIACGQETAAFQDLAEDLGASERLHCVDIRDRAGWSDDTSTGPKMAALLAASRLPIPSIPSMDIHSDGICLVLGDGDTALGAAEQLAPVMSVVCMISTAGEVIPPAGADMDIVSGKVTSATGSLEQFSVKVDGFAEWVPSGRGSRSFAAPQNNVSSDCDLATGAYCGK